MAILAILVVALAIATLMEARSSVETPDDGGLVLPQGAYYVCPATDEFQLPHSFVHIGDTDPTTALIRVRWSGSTALGSGGLLPWSRSPAAAIA